MQDQDSNVSYYDISSTPGFTFDSNYLFEPTLRTVSLANNSAIILTEHKRPMKAEDKSYKKWMPFGPELNESPSAGAICQDERYVALGTKDGDVILLDGKKGTILKTYRCEFSPIQKIVFTQDSKSFFAFGNGRVAQFIIEQGIISCTLKKIMPEPLAEIAKYDYVQDIFALYHDSFKSSGMFIVTTANCAYTPPITLADVPKEKTSLSRRIGEIQTEKKLVCNRLNLDMMRSSGQINMTCVENFGNITACIYNEKNIKNFDINVLSETPTLKAHRSIDDDEVISQVFLFKTGISAVLFKSFKMVILSKKMEQLWLISNPKMTSIFSETFIKYPTYNRESEIKINQGIVFLNTKELYKMSFIEWKQLATNLKQRMKFSEVFEICKDIYSGSDIKYFGVPESINTRCNEIENFVKPIIENAHRNILLEAKKNLEAGREIRREKIRLLHKEVQEGLSSDERNAIIQKRNELELEKSKNKNERKEIINKQIRIFEIINDLELGDFAKNNINTNYQNFINKEYLFKNVFAKVFSYIEKYNIYENVIAYFSSYAAFKASDEIRKKYKSDMAQIKTDLGDPTKDEEEAKAKLNELIKKHNQYYIDKVTKDSKDKHQNDCFNITIDILRRMDDTMIEEYWADVEETTNDFENLTKFGPEEPQTLLCNHQLTVKRDACQIYQQTTSFHMTELTEIIWLKIFNDPISPLIHYYNRGYPYYFKITDDDVKKDNNNNNNNNNGNNNNNNNNNNNEDKSLYWEWTEKNGKMTFERITDTQKNKTKSELYNFVMKVFFPDDSKKELCVTKEQKELMIGWLFTPTRLYATKDPDQPKEPVFSNYQDERCERIIPLIVQNNSAFGTLCTTIMAGFFLSGSPAIKLRDTRTLTGNDIIERILHTLPYVPFKCACPVLDKIAVLIIDLKVQLPERAINTILRWAFTIRESEVTIETREIIVTMIMQKYFTNDIENRDTNFIKACINSGFTSIITKYHFKKDSDINEMKIMYRVVFETFYNASLIHPREKLNDMYTFIENNKFDIVTPNRIMRDAIRDSCLTGEEGIFDWLILADSKKLTKPSRLFALLKDLDKTVLTAKRNVSGKKEEPKKTDDTILYYLYKNFPDIDKPDSFKIKSKDELNKKQHYAFLMALSMEEEEKYKAEFKKDNVQKYFFCYVCRYDKEQALPLLEKGVITSSDCLALCQENHALDATIYLATLYSKPDEAIKAIKKEICSLLYNIITREENTVKDELIISIDRISTCNKFKEPYDVLNKAFDLLQKSPWRGSDLEEMWSVLFDAFKLPLFKVQSKEYEHESRSISMFFSYFVVQVIARASPSFVLEQLHTKFTFLNTPQSRLIFENVFHYLNYENILSCSVRDMMLHDCKSLWKQITELTSRANTSFENTTICQTCHQAIKGVSGIGMKIFRCGHAFHNTSECCSTNKCPICNEVNEERAKKSATFSGEGSFSRRSKIRILDRVELRFKGKYGKDADETTHGDYVYFYQDLNVKKPKRVAFNIAKTAPTREINANLEI